MFTTKLSKHVRTQIKKNYDHVLMTQNKELKKLLSDFNDLNVNLSDLISDFSDCMILLCLYNENRFLKQKLRTQLI